MRETEDGPCGVKEALAAALSHLGAKVMDTSSSAGKDLLWRRLLSKQLSIISIQNRLLEKNNLLLEDLTARNSQLLQEVEELKRYNNAILSSTSEHFLSDFKGQSLQEDGSSRRRTYVIRRHFPGRFEKSEKCSTKEFKSLSLIKEPPIARKTRASAKPQDLVASRDLSWKRKRQRQIEQEARESPSINDRILRLPTFEIHLEQNYVSTSDPQYLPPAQFTQVGLETVNEVQPGNIEVQVPSWRNLRVDLSRLACGTEDIDDIVYLRRHLRSEEDEKRRKRWDAQKLREEEYVVQLKERLAQRRAAESRKRLCKGGARKTSEDGWDDLPWIEPFHPNPKEAQFLQVEEQVPINVFGRPLPAIPPSEFRLPWDPASSSL